MRAALIATLLVGVTVSFVVSAQQSTAVQERRETQHVSAVEALVSATDVELDDVFASAATTALAADTTWPSIGAFESFWETFTGSLSGDSTLAIVVAVPVGDLDRFVAAERAVTPTFDVGYLNPSPPADTHQVLARAVDIRSSIGIDLTSLPDRGDRLFSIAPGDTAYFSSDIRRAFSEPSDLQVITRRALTGPGGTPVDGWSILQLDLTSVMERVVGFAPHDAAVSMRVVESGTEVEVGRMIESDVPVSTRRLDVADLTIDVSVRTAGAPVEDFSSEVLWAGLAATAGLLVLVALTCAVVRQRRRAGLSAQDARCDPLTGLANRRWVDERLGALEGQPVAVLFCDLDRFKVVNDSAGHAAGDDLLQTLADRLTRAMDEHSTVARFGGDEFLVICNPADRPSAHAAAIAEGLRSAIAAPVEIGGTEFRPSMSVGIATADPLRAGGADELIRAADVALGRCKQRGGDRVVSYDDRLREDELDRLDLERELHSALDDRDFEMHFQPIVDHTGRVMSYEALVRWRRRGQLVLPDTFLPVVAELGRIVELGAIVMESAVADFAQHLADGDRVTLHVNVDAAQLAESDFADRVTAVLDAHGLAPSRLILELTEGEWEEPIPTLVPVLSDLADRGVRFAIDDFGAAYSGVGRALLLRSITEIKFDRSIVRALSDHRNRAFVAGLASTLLDIGVLVIVEGIESDDDLRLAQEAGVAGFQGFLFGRAEPAGQLSVTATASP
ncbi:MAG: bifunctional diguanylate cyclase/phosphodiesterase [Actinomycetota bacterium]